MLDYEQFQKIHEFFIQGQNCRALHLLMQIQAQHITLQDTIEVLQTRIEEFENILLRSNALYFENAFYWIRTGQEVQGPFCPHCYEGDAMLFRLHRQENAFFCQHCGAAYAYGNHIVHDTAVGDASNAPCPLPVAKRIPFIRPLQPPLATPSKRG